MYKLTIRKTCKAEKTLQGFQKAYGFIVDCSMKTVWHIYGFDTAEIAVFMDESIFRIRKAVSINE